MCDIPLRSYAYFALCKLSDAFDNLDSIISRLDGDDDSKSLILDISKDVVCAIDKLKNISL